VVFPERLPRSARPAQHHRVRTSPGDPMLFDTHLTEEFDALRDTVKRMCDAELAPGRPPSTRRTNSPPTCGRSWRSLGCSE
jgi:hypothetical protein